LKEKPVQMDGVSPDRLVGDSPSLFLTHAAAIDVPRRNGPPLISNCVTPWALLVIKSIDWPRSVRTQGRNVARDLGKRTLRNGRP
jgi:hypothetical protein